MIEAKIEKDEIKKLQNFFNATDKELNVASNYALKQAVNWMKSQLVKRIAQENKIQQKPLTEKTAKGASRVYTSTNPGDKTARLWLGVYKISLARLKPKQYGKQGTKKRKSSRAGVAAGVGGSIFREDAFLMPITKGNGSAAVVPYQVMKRSGKDRLPIEKQDYSYKESALNIGEDLQSQIPQKLIDALRSKLKWQTEKR